MYRQGDVWLEPCASARGARISPEGGLLVLARGEATGHFHSVSAAAAEMFRADSGEEFLHVKEATRLAHCEHAAILLEPGVYRLRHQREYTPETIRNVAD